ncbi:hypothetical protein ABZ894_28840 [Nocardia beijingensis]|uniref:hypothetical protein n=1 Tax=Nocardia beijingensis TaxID=95162 RepID=UPI00340887EC
MVEYKHVKGATDTPDDAAASRYIYIFYKLYIDHPDPVAAARKSAETSSGLDSKYAQPFERPLNVSDIGRQAHTYWQSIDQRANVEFLVSNMTVRVYVGGERSLSTDPVGLRQSFEESSVSIARGIASGLAAN